MDTIGERLQFIIRLKGLNANKVSLSTGLHASTIKNYIDNKGRPDFLKLEKISNELQVNYDWLVSGKGNHSDSFEKTKLTNKLDSDLTILLNQKDEKINSLSKEIEMLREKIEFLTEKVDFYRESKAVINDDLIEQINFMYAEMKKPILESKLKELYDIIQYKKEEKKDDSSNIFKK
ncbi:hypothetical protein BWK59_14275 [Flavobacterium davisii]|uniref:HTH cro/C1-type domain-containing protein n=1 Tax=Flavobacterium davisii TaxID=2906077 RepID=A0A246GF39_9FLAO|nr:helix-turn-helix transcriptional regulator [Flavobacterium davisii]OWP82732.1 hypothetical protein BWK59_14275 [Flavobacterium davisii]